MTENSTKTECDRCGTCCIKGGPALHHEDGILLRLKFLKREQLVTIRKGEPVLSLSSRAPVPAENEIVKIKGSNIEWSCLFFRETEASCAIYEHRPLECSLLKCWDPADLERVAEKNLLSRHDILSPHDPFLPFIREHEKECSLESLPLFLAALERNESRQKGLTELSSLVNKDLALRSKVWARFHLSLDLELFLFGRPLFKILQPLGLETQEINGACVLSLTPS